MVDLPADALWRRWAKAAMATARGSTDLPAEALAEAGASAEVEATPAEWAEAVGLPAGVSRYARWLPRVSNWGQSTISVSRTRPLRAPRQLPFHEIVL